ncbi:MAG TPA: acetyl-CoA hydrolase/transferase C-terminal domain-containing protein [Candidatus Sulfotelmatobacter sp.]|nr:acetyl-CoA hydrolase/transferase C-terminal domain-containing protein [Candidatus Sulfotelmatobacter sp.]
MSMSWEMDYKKRLNTADDALRCVRSGMRVYIQPGCAEPETLVEALMRRAPELRDVEIVHMMTMGCAPYVAPEMAGHFRHNAMFIGANVRAAINDGRADYTPIYLSEIEGLFESGEMPIDVALIAVSPPDSHGFCSFGVGVDTTLTAAKCARYVVAQVNDSMPRTYGDSFIHVSDIDALVESSRPLCALAKPVVTDLQIAIARNVARLIEDGSVLQTGIGGIPDAVLPMLMDRKDLAVHSELCSDGVIPLIEAGVITGARKNFKPRKIILGFALGSKRLFEFVDNNPIFEFHPTAYTNDPLLIARNDNMVAINSALQVDLTGQVCSDSIGNQFYSGIGGQVDFLRGASRSKGGKPIIAISSTAKQGTISRIVPTLDPGAGVVTSRGLIRYIVTEYGVAYLHGKSIRERAKALIEIAHPDFRSELYEYCEKTKWLQNPQAARSAVSR